MSSAFPIIVRKWRRCQERPGTIGSHGARRTDRDAHEGEIHRRVQIRQLQIGAGALDWKMEGVVMPMKGWAFPFLILLVVAAAGAGFAVSHIRDASRMHSLKAARDLAFDCRKSGKTEPPCPVVYRNTRIEWRDRVQTVTAPDKRQAARIASLSGELAQARRRIHALESSRHSAVFRATAANAIQNGSLQHPYINDDRCPSGTVAVYDSGLSGTGMSVRRFGDPNVCYVRTRLYGGRIALSSPPR
jgi:hypothetical protein